jgi:hypothetical protein
LILMRCGSFATIRNRLSASELLSLLYRYVNSSCSQGSKEEEQKDTDSPETKEQREPELQTGPQTEAHTTEQIAELSQEQSQVQAGTPEPLLLTYREEPQEPQEPQQPQQPPEPLEREQSEAGPGQKPEGPSTPAAIGEHKEPEQKPEDLNLPGGDPAGDEPREIILPFHGEPTRFREGRDASIVSRTSTGDWEVLVHFPVKEDFASEDDYEKFRNFFANVNVQDVTVVDAEKKIGLDANCDGVEQVADQWVPLPPGSAVRYLKKIQSDVGVFKRARQDCKRQKKRLPKRGKKKAKEAKKGKEGKAKEAKKTEEIAEVQKEVKEPKEGKEITEAKEEEKAGEGSYGAETFTLKSGKGLAIRKGAGNSIQRVTRTGSWAPFPPAKYPDEKDFEDGDYIRFRKFVALAKNLDIDPDQVDRLDDTSFGIDRTTCRGSEQVAGEWVGLAEASLAKKDKVAAELLEQAKKICTTKTTESGATVEQEPPQQEAPQQPQLQLQPLEPLLPLQPLEPDKPQESKREEELGRKVRFSQEPPESRFVFEHKGKEYGVMQDGTIVRGLKRVPMPSPELASEAEKALIQGLQDQRANPCIQKHMQIEGKLYAVAVDPITKHVQWYRNLAPSDLVTDAWQPTKQPAGIDFVPPEGDVRCNYLIDDPNAYFYEIQGRFVLIEEVSPLKI